MGLPMPKSPFPGFIRTFRNLYVYKGSYREGAFGLIMSMFFAQYNFLCWAKRWEIEMKAGRIKPDQPRVAWIEKIASILSFDLAENLPASVRSFRRAMLPVSGNSLLYEQPLHFIG